MDFKIVFAKVLKEIRKEKKISQEELALNADLERTFISLLERAIKQPSLTTIFKISKALNIKSSDLIKKIEDELEK